MFQQMFRFGQKFSDCFGIAAVTVIIHKHQHKEKSGCREYEILMFRHRAKARDTPVGALLGKRQSERPGMYRLCSEKSE